MVYIRSCLLKKAKLDWRRQKQFFFFLLMEVNGANLLKFYKSCSYYKEIFKTLRDGPLLAPPWLHHCRKIAPYPMYISKQYSLHPTKNPFLAS